MNKNPFATSKSDIASSLGKVTRSLGEASASQKAKSLGLPYADLRLLPMDLEALTLFTRQETEQCGGTVFALDGLFAKIGTVDPQNFLLKEKIKELSGKYKIEVYIISEDSLAYALKSYEKVVSPHIGGEAVVRIEKEVREDELKTFLNTRFADAPAGEIAEKLLALAFVLTASDIHLEVGEKEVLVRFRLDGVLQTLARLPKSTWQGLLSRFKLLSKLKFNVTNIPQDGRLTFYYLDKSVDVRVSTLPSAFGESLVLRLLGVGATLLDIDALGLIGRSREIIEKELKKPNGCILTTGPTGSGKTTTLYSFLNELNDPGTKIITLEDPIEYRLNGIQQTPIDHNVNFDFATALRSVLRQDPDVVMIGEIRDSETAETALQASLTGHMVLSTLHTNDSFGAVPRLTTFGVKPYTIAPALNAVIAQRLVRRLCEKCKQVSSLPQKLQETVDGLLSAIPASAGVSLPQSKVFYHSVGCESCHGLGYKGRVGIYEVIHINDAQKELILRGASMLEMKKQALIDGTLTMAQDGLLKALDGITDVEEVFRVAGGE